MCVHFCGSPYELAKILLLMKLNLPRLNASLSLQTFSAAHCGTLSMLIAQLNSVQGGVSTFNNELDSTKLKQSLVHSIIQLVAKSNFHLH